MKPLLYCSSLILLFNAHQTHALKLGDQAADFLLPTINISDKQTPKSTSLSDYKNNIVLVDFWASWCHSCRKAFSFLNQLQHQYKNENLVVLAINEDSNVEQAKRFLMNNQVEFLSVFDKDGKIASKYQLIGMPSSFLIDKNGVIRGIYSGFNKNKATKIEQAIKTLIKTH